MPRPLRRSAITSTAISIDRGRPALASRSVPTGALLAAACVALAALSLLLPSSPTYDPWAWVIWGRELLHGHLATTDGPSWKPLPIAFTAPFALLGDAAPQLWLVVARAGGLAAVALAFAVARRLGGAVAGVAAAAGLVLAPWLLRNVALGNSEGLLAACVLAAVDRELAGRPRQAFGWALAAALLRPEAWPFFAAHAAWLLWRERRAAVLPVAAGLLAVPLLWFVPEGLSSGSFTRAAERAQHPLKGSPAFYDDAARRVVEEAMRLVLWPVWLGLALALAAVLLRRVPRARAVPAALLAATALAWTGIVAYMTTRGYSGNVRYLILPVVLAVVVAGAGVGWTAQLLPRALRGRAATALLAAGAAAMFALPWSGMLDGVLRYLRYQGELPHHLATAIARAGGPERVRRCGGVATGPFLVPAVAWRLRLRIEDVGYEPRGPTAVLMTRTNEGSKLVPDLATLGGAPLHEVARAPDWRILETCR